VVVAVVLIFLYFFLGVSGLSAAVCFPPLLCCILKRDVDVIAMLYIVAGVNA
jgi:hypothetical protein